MKFTDGQWLGKKGYQYLYPLQCFDAVFKDGELAVYVYTKPVESRNQTLDQGTFTLRLTTDRPDTIHVKLNHYEGIRKKGPAFQCRTDLDRAPKHWEDEDAYYYKSGRMSARIQKNPFLLAYYYDGVKLTASEPRAAANIVDRDEQVYMREQLSLSVGESVYGLGERFTPFLKNGQIVEMWNEDGGTASELSYKNIPFYVTSKNYGVFVMHPEKVSFEAASEHVERVQFSVSGQQLEYVMIGGTSVGEVVKNYNLLTGIPALPPAWSFGLWLSTSFTTNYDEETVNHFVDGMAERDLPIHVFHFDCFWMKGCEWCNFTWDPEVFPDPQGMLDRLKAKGLKICVWINPYIAQKSPLFLEAMENHYLVEYPNGDVWQWDKWQAGMGLVDFTNPEACRWYQGKLKGLLDMGVDCFKTDFGERIPVDVVYYDGSDPVKMHNYYTFLYNKCVFDLLEEQRGKNEAVLFARSATAGGQQFPVHWGGDCWGTYESMAESLRGGLSLAMSGFGFWSHDISGFEKTAPPDIYKRWAAFGLLSTHSRLHGSSSYRVPWLFDDEAVDVLRHFINLRCQLMPYLWSQANLTAKTGYPMLRSMVMDFSDTACKYLDTQYMLGESLLVAPVFSEDGSAEYYLPEGRWMDLLTGEWKDGGRYYQGVYDYYSLPLYVKAGTILPLGANKKDAVYDYAEEVQLHVLEIADQESAESIIYDSAGEIALSVVVSRDGDTYRIVRQQGEGDYLLLFRGLMGYQEISGGSAEVTNQGVKVLPEGNQVSLKI